MSNGTSTCSNVSGLLNKKSYFTTHDPTECIKVYETGKEIAQNKSLTHSTTKAVSPYVYRHVNDFS